RARLWTVLRRQRLALLLVEPALAAAFPRPAVSLAAALRIPKLVLVDPAGGLLAGVSGSVSFADAHVLETVLRQGEAEWSGLGDRRPLLLAVREALDAGIEAVNLCGLDGVADELFTYVGS